MKLFSDIRVRIPRSFDKITHSDAAGGIVMLLCIVLALILQNGSYSTSYRHWLDTTAGIVFGDFILMKPLLLWINDGLITIFFFSIGLQLKIEFVEGHLSDPRNILLPSIAAIAGICTPALIFILFNYHDEFAMRGWAIPTSTDTAFAVALIMLLGKRVPNSLKILLLSISVFDDMGAMAVVAIFYNSGLDVYALIPAAVSIVGLMILNFFGVGRKSLYIALGAIIWFSILKSGVHATIAGIITAFSMPMRDRSGAPVVQEVSDNIGLWVSFAILPLFTLANAGVDLGNINISTMFSNVSLGIILALIIGKPLGIFTVIYLASRYKLVQLPSDVNTKQLYGMSLLTGIGFSMAMFYDSLAYEGSSIYGYADSLAILIGATFSGIHGYCYLRFFACKTALIEYRPWLPAPTGYHGTARTANLYSLENPIQGPSSVAPTAAAVAEANKRSAAAAEAAQKAIEAAEAASKVAELLKKASDKEQDEQNLAEVQLAAAQAAKAAATVAVTATKIDTSEDNAQKTQSAEAVLKTVSEVAQEAEETVERAIDEDKAVENQATLADEDKQDNDNKVANNETEELKSKNTTKVSTADEAKDSESDKSEVKSQDTVKASKEAQTVIAVDSEGLAKVEKTAVKSTDESAAVVDDSPLNADDFASTTVSAKSESDESKTQEEKIASNQSSTSSDDEVSEQSDENESSASSKAQSDVQESVESEAKTVKKIKAKTKYELSVEEVDHSSEKIAEHKEVAQGTAKAVAAYLSNIVGKAKVEVSENIERSDEEKAALRAAAAARVAAIKAAEIEAQALAEAAVAEAKAKAAAQAAEAKAKEAAQESKSKADTNAESDSKAIADEQETLLQESTVDVAELSKIASESKETVKDNAASDELNAADFAPKANDSADIKAEAQEGDVDKATLEASSKDESKEADPSEACASKSADSSDDEALKAAAEAQSAQEEVAKAAAEAEAAKAKALEAKQAVEKAAHEARVAAEIAAAKKAEGKQKAKAQQALEAQKKAEEEGGHKEESDTLGEVTAKAASAVSTVASVVAAPAVKAVKIVTATASVTASVTAAAAKAAVKVVEHKDKAEDEQHDDKKDTTKDVADTLVKEVISAKDPRFSESNESSKDGSHDDSNATDTEADAKATAKAEAKATAAADKDSAVSDSAAVKPSTQDTTQKAAIKEQTQAKTVDAKESKSFAEENSYSEKADDLTRAHDETVKSVLEAHDAPEFAVANNNELNASDLSQKISTLDEQQAKVTLQAASDDDDLTVESVLAVKSASSDVAANSNAQEANGNMPTAEGNAATAASDDLNAEDYQDKKPSDAEDKDEQKEDSSAVKSVVGKLAGIIRKGKD